MNCGNCSREIRGERASCLYCGWTKAEGLSAPTAARPVIGSEDPRTFRAGATTWRFLVWAVTATAAGVVLLKHPPRIAGVPDRFPVIGLAIAFLVLGPLAFGAQLLRTILVSVTVDPRSGLVLRGGRSVPWDDIESVEFAGLHFVSDQGVIRFLLDIIRSLSHWTLIYGLWGGLMALLRIGLIAAVGVLIALVGILSGILLPVFLLLSPWEPRVIIRTKDGALLAWRDLIGEADFVHRVEMGLRRATAGGRAPHAGKDNE